MPGHHLDEGKIEPAALEALQLAHLGLAHHAGHRRGAMIHLAHTAGRFTPCLEPALHPADLRALCGGDILGQLGQLKTVGAAVDQPGHLDGLLVMRDHALHERHVGLIGRGLGWRPGTVVGCLAASGQQRHGGDRQRDASHRRCPPEDVRCVRSVESAAHLRDAHSSTGNRARGGSRQRLGFATGV
jgi:hypothetical protein